MNTRTAPLARIVSIILFLLFFAGTVALNVSCEKDDNPASSPECGQGPKTWDTKAGLCRDSMNRVVPDYCCGR